METFTTYYDSPVGTLHLQCTNEHITAILFSEAIAASLKNDTHPILRQCCHQLDEYFSGERKQFHLPVTQVGTGFQATVWNLLSSIPYGTTVSYLHLAKQYGDVKAIRAVAAANGKNKLAIVIPCHRVIGSNATLTGYAGGLWRKQWLLEHEAKHHSGVQLLPFDE